jgi:hypothetical protein
MKATRDEFDGDWQAFPNLPGKHLAMEKRGRRFYEIVDDSNGEVIAGCTYSRIKMVPTSIMYQGGTYKWRRVGRYHVLDKRRETYDFVDVATNVAALRQVGHHHAGGAGATVTLAGYGKLHFRVRGIKPNKSLMSATGESGETLIEYRQDRSRRRSPFDRFGWTEMVLSPAALTISNIDLVIPVSRIFLVTYYLHGGAG